MGCVCTLSIKGDHREFKASHSNKSYHLKIRDRGREGGSLQELKAFCPMVKERNPTH